MYSAIVQAADGLYHGKLEGIVGRAVEVGCTKKPVARDFGGDTGFLPTFLSEFDMKSGDKATATGSLILTIVSLARMPSWHQLERRVGTHEKVGL